MKNPKAGQLATLVNKDMCIGCIIRVTKQKSIGALRCEECKKSNYESLCGWAFCPMVFFEKSCAQTIPEPDLYPKVVKFFKV